MTRLYANFRWGLTGQSQSMLVADGRVVARGPGVRADAATVDLGGRFLLPGLTDCHCHILPTGLDLAKLHLGSSTTPKAVLDAVRDRNASHPSGWLLAVHYDQNRWGGEHVTRHDLDRVDSERPILLRHVNGHASIANSVAMTIAGIGDYERDPKDGSFGRDADGKVNGVLYEGAHERVSSHVPLPTLEEATEAILRAGESMTSYGLISAADMQAQTRDLPAYELAAKRGCPIQMRLYMVWRDVFGPRADRERIESLRKPQANPRVCGVKLFADGAIGSGTAAIYGAYLGKPEAEHSGQLMYPPETLSERVRIADEAGFVVTTHAIGDYALDVVLDAYEATGNSARHRIEHAMLMSDSQIERARRLGVSLAMQPEFLHRFGHAYRAQLGPERAARLKRFRSVLDAGIALAFSSDRPICAGNPWTGIDTACCRPDGFDASENLTRAEAIGLYLGPAADIDDDKGNFGRLEPGESPFAIVTETDPLLPGEPETLSFLQAFE